MLTLRKSEERGHFDHGWLDTYHSFSFADYHDPAHMGFRDLRVINEDRVQAGKGFPPHSHQDMEIVTYILEGALQHRDSMGNGSIIRPGDVQRMSAGTGVTHSEYNPSTDEAVHLLQIWILPKQAGLVPSYEQKRFSDEQKNGTWLLIASPNGAEGSVTLHQDARILATRIRPQQEVFFQVKPGRHLWLQMVRGEVELGEHRLKEGDGVAISQESQLVLCGRQDAEALLFDLV